MTPAEIMNPFDWHGDHFAAECDNTCKPEPGMSGIQLRDEVKRLEAALAVSEARWREYQDFALAEQRDGVMLRAALRQILEDPEAAILDSHRDDGWAALGTTP